MAYPHFHMLAAHLTSFRPFVVPTLLDQPSQSAIVAIFSLSQFAQALKTADP